MPIDHKKKSTFFSQRSQYQKGGIGRRYWDFRDEKIFSFIKSSHKNILDVGCGEGITLEKLAAKFPAKNIKGIDVMSENVKICRRYNLAVLLDSIYDLKIADNSVDLCVLSEVIEHLENIDSALDNIKRVLKIGGEAIIVFPNDKNFKIARILFFKFREAFADSGHVNKLTPKIIKKKLKQKGFKIIKFKNIPFKFWFLSLHSIALIQK